MRAKFSLLMLVLVTGPFSVAWSETPMSPWSEERIKEGVSRSDAFHPFPTYSQREIWISFKGNKRFAEGLEQVISRARDLKSQDLPSLSASKYLDFQRTGNRTHYQDLLNQREQFLQAFALAECLQATSEFMEPLIDVIWAFCEESDWCLPAHTKGLVDMQQPHIDLRSAKLSADLAMILSVFGDALPGPVRMRIRYELDRRTFDPYLTREFGWMKSNHNWNSVCNGSVLRAALLVTHDAGRLAQLIQRAQTSMCAYLEGFDTEGGTAEGISYWRYGFSHYVSAAWLLNLYSAGRLNLLEPPLVRKIALFPQRIELSPGRFPSFSDGGEEGGFEPSWNYLADALGLSEMRLFISARSGKTTLVSTLESLFQNGLVATPPEEEARFVPSAFDFLPGIEWMISRAQPDDPEGFVLAAQGGNNGENHNHNDVGNFIIHYRGESLIVDLGAPVYDKGFFGPDRYTYLAARSLSHSVPLVNGCEQRAGKEAAARLQTSHDLESDVFVADLTSVYPPEAGLRKLVRTIQFHRQPELGWLEVKDEAVFDRDSNQFESPLVTYGSIESVSPSILLIRGERGALKVLFDSASLTPAIREFDAHEAGLRTADEHPVVRRIAFQSLQAGREISIHLRIDPIP